MKVEESPVGWERSATYLKVLAGLNLNGSELVGGGHIIAPIKSEPQNQVSIIIHIIAYLIIIHLHSSTNLRNQNSYS